ncbi:ribbon-helix-helix protein, CopG family [Pseudomonas sp. Irchel 3H3]|uniref:ribbon-helix-helix protein, CopG family n=1 Tax=Pseudomonas sp. Irchel 3H3 TaxID=2009038 RepID=UPI000BA2C3DA|nr:ribbon-helix-helix protein, CopG family [Pseudomonas sp. Irchel 3H3]
MPNRTARLTILIDQPTKKELEDLAALSDLTTSQVIRKLIKDYLEASSSHPVTTLRHSIQ